MPDKNIIEELSEKLSNKNGQVFIVQIAPAVRVAIGEYLGFPPGENVIGRLITACKEIGSDYVFDTNVGADLTIVEEAYELVKRLKSKESLPMFTTCCPAWYSFVERCYSELTPHLSTLKSPQAILGSIIKTYFAQKMGIDYKKITHVVLAPCIVKKQEAKDKQIWVHKNENIPNIDYVLTTREAAALFISKKIDLSSLEDSKFDNPLGESTGAGAIFGTTGGVMEAVIRTAYYYLTNKELENYEIEDVRNTAEKKEGRAEIGGFELNLATINGLREAKVMLDKLKAEGSLPYQFVEVMACPLGCIGGGGQPANDHEILLKRRQAIFQYDKEHAIRAAHQNPYLKEIYDKYLGEVGGKKAKQFLHRELGVD